MYDANAVIIYIYTVAPRYNAVVGVHDIGPRCKRGALGVLISATRELLNNSDPCTKSMNAVEATVHLQHCLIRQHAVYGTYYASINVYYF